MRKLYAILTLDIDTQICLLAAEADRGAGDLASDAAVCGLVRRQQLGALAVAFTCRAAGWVPCARPGVIFFARGNFFQTARGKNTIFKYNFTHCL